MTGIYRKCDHVFESWCRITWASLKVLQMFCNHYAVLSIS